MLALARLERLDRDVALYATYTAAMSGALSTIRVWLAVRCGAAIWLTFAENLPFTDLASAIQQFSK